MLEGTTLQARRNGLGAQTAAKLHLAFRDEVPPEEAALLSDVTDTATWRQFMIGNVYSMYWLNDYSMYFAKICSKSWDKTVALHVRAWPNR